MILVLAMVPATAFARNCDVAAGVINEAAELLKNVGQQTNIEHARQVARRLQRALDDAAVEASDCDCEKSASKLDSAVAHVRRARNTDTRPEFSEQINRAIDDFNMGVAHMEICIAS